MSEYFIERQHVELQKDVSRKKIEWEKEKALLLQKIEQLETQLVECDGREKRLKDSQTALVTTLSRLKGDGELKKTQTMIQDLTDEVRLIKASNSQDLCTSLMGKDGQGSLHRGNTIATRRENVTPSHISYQDDHSLDRKPRSACLGTSGLRYGRGSSGVSSKLTVKVVLQNSNFSNQQRNDAMSFGYELGNTQRNSNSSNPKRTTRENIRSNPVMVLDIKNEDSDYIPEIERDRPIGERKTKPQMRLQRMDLDTSETSEDIVSKNTAKVGNNLMQQVKDRRTGLTNQRSDGSFGPTDPTARMSPTNGHPNVYPSYDPYIEARDDESCESDDPIESPKRDTQPRYFIKKNKNSKKYLQDGNYEHQNDIEEQEDTHEAYPRLQTEQGRYSSGYSRQYQSPHVATEKFTAYEGERGNHRPEFSSGFGSGYTRSKHIDYSSQQRRDSESEEESKLHLQKSTATAKIRPSTYKEQPLYDYSSQTVAFPSTGSGHHGHLYQSTNIQPANNHQVNPKSVKVGLLRDQYGVEPHADESLSQVSNKNRQRYTTQGDSARQSGLSGHKKNQLSQDQSAVLMKSSKQSKVMGTSKLSLCSSRVSQSGKKPGNRSVIQQDGLSKRDVLEILKMHKVLQHKIKFLEGKAYDLF